MPYPEITLATETIHNPDEPRHYMRFRPIAGEVIVRSGDIELARSDKAMRMIEVARDVYDAVVYMPADSVSTALQEIPEKSSHCPLKGDASYFALPGQEPIAWSYQETLPFASVIKGYVAFYADRVSIEEIGKHIADE